MKTKIVCFGSKAEKEHGTVNYLGFTLYRNKNRRGGYKVGVKTEKSRIHRSMQKIKALIRGIRHVPFPSQHQQINRFLRGHYNYYGVGAILGLALLPDLCVL